MHVKAEGYPSNRKINPNKGERLKVINSYKEAGFNNSGVGSERQTL